ncbi:glutamate racemase [Treponema sp. R6D11]
MDIKPILFIDSGIGGLPYCKDFLNRNKGEEVWYLADRANFPYGQRNKNELSSILITLIEKLLKKTAPKIIVLACNSATVSSIERLRQHFPNIPFVGTVPAIKPAANASKSGKVGVLGTARTIEDPYNQNLADECEKKCEIIGIAAPDLVQFVEERFDTASEKEKKEIVKKYIEIFCAKGADGLVLGCTHFLFLLNEFEKEAAPFIKIFSSLDGVTKRIEYLLDENSGALRAEKSYQPVNRLILTGTEPADALWQTRAKELGFDLYLLDTL